MGGCNCCCRNGVEFFFSVFVVALFGLIFLRLFLSGVEGGLLKGKFCYAKYVSPTGVGDALNLGTEKGAAR